MLYTAAKAGIGQSATIVPAEKQNTGITTRQ
jgi:hypothetical protein